MRSVTTPIAKLGLQIGDAITLKLVDSVGVVCVAPNGYALDEAITMGAEVWTISLLENDAIPMMTQYKLGLPNGVHFNFTVPGDSYDDAPHDLTPLLQLGCTDDVIDPYTGELADDFKEQLDIYYLGGNPHFNWIQKELTAMYEYYADNIYNVEPAQMQSTIDIMRMMDEYLATL